LLRANFSSKQLILLNIKAHVMPYRGRKKTYKGAHRHFTSEDDLAREQEKQRKEREWRQMKGIPSDEEDEGDDADKKKASSDPAAAAAAPGALPPTSSDEESEDEEDEDNKPKGVSHLIEIENPNHVAQKTKKVSQLAEGAAPTLSRREREELEKQQAKERYEKMHLAGKTDEARADLARLALIRKQREDAAKKRDEERKAQEEAKAAAEKRLLDKKAKSGGDTK
jgi:hypothetical protein